MLRRRGEIILMSSLLMASIFASSQSKKRRQLNRKKRVEINNSIAKFRELKDKGIITDLEFDIIKEKYLNKHQSFFPPYTSIVIEP